MSYKRCVKLVQSKRNKWVNIAVFLQIFPSVAILLNLDVLPNV